jgi:hypothetical protein
MKPSEHHDEGGLRLPRRISPFGSLVAAALVSLLGTSTAAAALFLVLEPSSGRPGTEVTGQTGGNGAFVESVEPLPTYLVARSTAGAVTEPDDSRLVEIGKLIVDAAGDGRITFDVPEVDPGKYSVMVFCPSCAPYSAGRTMLWVADFEVTSASPSTDTRAPGTPPVATLIGRALLAVAITFAALLLAPRWSKRPLHRAQSVSRRGRDE